MRLCPLCRQASAFDKASQLLRREAKKTEFARVRKVRKAREDGTNPLHKAQYINAYIEASSAALTHQRRVESEFNATKRSIHSEPRSASSPEALLTLAKDLEQRYGTSAPPAAVSATAVGRPHRRAEVPVAFGEWRSDNYEVQRRLRAADFAQHCLIREARTPPRWSPEALRRMLPLGAASPLHRLLSRADDAAQAMDDEERRNAYIDALYRQEMEVTGGTAPRGLQLGSAQQTALTSVLLQKLVSQTASWVLAYHYLEAHIDLAPANAGGRRRADSLAEYRQRTSQLVAVFAEALRYADLPPEKSVPFEQWEALLAGIQRRLEKLSEREGAGSRGGRLAPVVAAPILSVVCSAHSDGVEPVGPKRLQALCEKHLMHYSWRSVPPLGEVSEGDVKAKPAGQRRCRLTYMPAAAWGEYLRALRRSGATLADLQRATDDITDSTKTLHGEEKLLRSAHVWNGYLASVHDAAHATEVYESNRAHYGLRETPATVATLMSALAKHGDGAGSIKKGLALYARLKATAGSQLVGVSSVLVALVDLHESAADLQALLALCADYQDVLVYVGMPEAVWRGDTHGLSGLALHESIMAIQSTEREALLGLTPTALAYFDTVCASYPVPPVFQHRLRAAIDVVAAGLRKTLEEEQLHRSETAPSITAEDLADLM